MLDPPGASVAAILSRCREPIVASWLDRVLSLRNARYGQRPRHEIEEWTSQNLDAVIRHLSDGSTDELEAHLRRVIEVRRQLGFRINEVVEGLLLLMEAAVPHVLAARPRDAPEPFSSLFELESCFRRIVARTADLYADAMRSSVERLTVLEERQKLARDLHDSVSQAIYGVSLYSEAAARQLAAGDQAGAAESLVEARDASLQALREMRLLLFQLRPPNLAAVGLAPALRERLSAVEGRAGIRTDFRGEGVDRLDPRVEDGLHRIAQEALNNVLKHAMAERVRVDLGRVEDRVVLEIEDDGRGFSVEEAEDKGGLGLRSMRERAAELAGRFVLRSRPGEGTRIRVEVAFAPAPERGGAGPGGDGEVVR